MIIELPARASRVPGLEFPRGTPQKFNRPMLIGTYRPSLVEYLPYDSQSGRVSVKHEANIPSGGHAEDIDLGRFLAQGGLGPEKQELLRLIGTLVDAAPDR